MSEYSSICLNCGSLRQVNPLQSPIHCNVWRGVVQKSPLVSIEKLKNSIQEIGFAYIYHQKVLFSVLTCQMVYYLQ